MAKDLYIVRHAKSDWSFGVSDFERPLNSRGFADAPHMAERLATSGLLPQLLISSTAKRALTTAQIFAERLHIPISDIQLAPSIYEAQLHTLLKIVNGIEDKYDIAAIFGHNPGFSILANYLTSGEIYTISTAGIVHIHFPDAETWQEISGDTGLLKNYTYPKEMV